ncbi:hypothetical protein COT50_00250 [candidate division WWE3 bacterium CG08_land_8_20_14_0_20_41_10]|uniref:SGNH hydrolase-type esterase domain-containing protein n=1 Tax=candidate division WWE3 bacterium CG08_land_8_20_14_0_20_41_10 TaxID=1975085 RepID=A0A2H0XD17_UNCKA|nr:MAG: hypothetical protein COT50_00250 [candidate division WWE3 bacterium CG08_land_8_20_14_0_20_41_10]
MLTKTNAQIILINLPYLGASNVVPFPFNNALDMRTRQFNKIILEVGQGGGLGGRVKIIDLYSPMCQPFLVDSKYYASDHFHPSDEGYLLWGKIINAD